MRRFLWTRLWIACALAWYVLAGAGVAIYYFMHPQSGSYIAASMILIGAAPVMIGMMLKVFYLFGMLIFGSRFPPRDAR